MATAPPPIKLDDLDREELLQLFKERMLFSVRPADLWGARWDVLSRRALQAPDRELEAYSAYVAALQPPERGIGARALSALMKGREARRLAHEAADRAAKRAEAAQARAWAALEACWGKAA